MRSPTFSWPESAGRAAGHQFADRDVVVELRQHRADAHQREPHRNVEVLRRPRAQVVGVRLDRRGVGVHERLEHVRCC